MSKVKFHWTSGQHGSWGDLSGEERDTGFLPDLRKIAKEYEMNAASAKRRIEAALAAAKQLMQTRFDLEWPRGHSEREKQRLAYQRRWGKELLP